MMLAEKPIEEMAPGLYLIAGFGNIGVIVTDEGVALIDTGMTFDREAALRPLRTLTDKPVRYIIYTHGHADHAANAGPILEEVARIGLRHDLRAAGATDEQIAAALDALRVALAEVTGDEFPDPADYAEAVAEVAMRVTAQFASQGDH